MYAHWTVSTYAITLNQNGATSNGTASVMATSGSSTLSSSITNPQKTGYVFDGWTSTQNGSTIVINASGALVANVSGYTGANGIWTATEGKTLYARWIKVLTFSSSNPFTLKVVDGTKYWNGTLEYSTNTTTWSVWNGTTTLSSASHNGSQKIYMRGTGNTYITGEQFVNDVFNGMNRDPEFWTFPTGSNISCNGNIETLLDYGTVSLGGHPIMASCCYVALFYNCTSLISAPSLPATTLAEYCYAYMFAGCTSLATAPALPATTLTYGCYGGMFSDCTSLSSAPALPATTLADWCYVQMFDGCTSLTSAPSLPATTLAQNCYQYMFYGCTSLTSAPALPATTLAENCYQYMFRGCTSLISAPSLPATTLADWC